MDAAFYTGGLVALINVLSIAITHIINKRSASTKALQLLMQDRLNRLCHKALEQGTITETQLHTIHEMHKAYKGLNGNGYFDAILPMVDALLQHE